MLNVALTFDYELFFGENNGTVDEILFKPTEKLMDVLNQHGIKATFFVDVLSVYMHQQYGLEEYCEKFIKQMKRMVLLGHDVQLHIHSNWLKSQYIDGKWEFDTEHYRIHTFGFDEDEEMSVPQIIKWGKTFLEAHLKDVDSNYRCIAYRAGGYCIQPHKALFDALNKNGIFIDSSVSAQQQANGINVYDYSGIPQKQNGWWVKNAEPLAQCSSSQNGDTFEVPVVCTPASLLRRIINPKAERNLNLGMPRGTYIGQKTGETIVPRKVSKLKVLLSYCKMKRMLTCDSMHYSVIIRELRKRARCAKRDEYAAVIGHPKLVNDIWIWNFDALLSAISKIPDCRTITMRQIADRLGM